MTVAGVKTARAHPRTSRLGGRSARPVVVARATLAMPPPPAIDRSAAVAANVEVPSLARRRDLHVARRLRRRDAFVGLGVLAATLGATVAVLDVFH